jgi:hypothetical protein
MEGGGRDILLHHQWAFSSEVMQLDLERQTEPGSKRRCAMHMKNLLEKIAYLEFVNDQLSTELSYVDKLLRAIGFSDGLKTVKSAALEIFDEEKKQIAQGEDIPPTLE